MIILLRRSLFVLMPGLVLASLIISLLVPVHAHADVGVQPVLPGGSSIKPESRLPSRWRRRS